ncbi:MAG: Pr6Pr family membrane protein [Spirochaetales bacterium]|nr:Pr6Pr family membrane protein [Spirochaetales bacterium]
MIKAQKKPQIQSTDDMKKISIVNIPVFFRIAVCLTALFGTIMRIVLSFYINPGIEVFLYFTIQSNIMVCAFLLIELFRDKKKKSPHPALQGGIVLYILITGIIYNTMLASGIQAEGINLIILTINHTLTPILFFIDWIISSRKGLLKWKHLLLWLIYPLAYLVAGSIEGAVKGQFRYPFLDFIHQKPAYFSLGLTVVISAFVLVGIFIILMDKKLSPRIK